MKLEDTNLIHWVKPSVNLFKIYPESNVEETDLDTEAIKKIGMIAGTCFSGMKNQEELNSTNTYEKCRKRVENCIKNGHHSVLEHVNLTLEIITDRGTSHALVRHRHIAVTQHSTIYSKSKGKINLIGYDEDTIPESAYKAVVETCENIQKQYEKLTEEYSLPASIARDILPNMYATKLIITTSLREWFYILERRKSQKGDAFRMWIFDNQLDTFLRKHYPIIYEWMRYYYANHHI